MKFRWLLLAFGLLVAVGFGVAWAGGGLAGKPTLPLSDEKGTSEVFPAQETNVACAITNAFGFFKYHDMMLTDPVGEDWRSLGWHPTNGFLLVPTLSALATVPTKGPLGVRRLRYVATFHITLNERGGNETEITVRTVSAKVLDGLALGHGGIAASTAKVPPVRQEEENVLKAVAAQLGLAKGATRSLK